MTLPKFRKINVQSYRAGKSELSRIKNIVKLSANESALGVSPKVKKEINKKINFSKYPDSKSNNLRLAISKFFKCNFEKVICGAGSDEIIQIICQLFLKAKDEVVVSQYSFLMYRIYSKIAGANVLFARENNYKTSVSEIMKKVSNKTKIVFWQIQIIQQALI
jgi:histidinol-phosphate aminotransferase